MLFPLYYFAELFQCTNPATGLKTKCNHCYQNTRNRLASLNKKQTSGVKTFTKGSIVEFDVWRDNLLRFFDLLYHKLHRPSDAVQTIIDGAFLVSHLVKKTSLNRPNPTSLHILSHVLKQAAFNPIHSVLSAHEAALEIKNIMTSLLKEMYYDECIHQYKAIAPDLIAALWDIVGDEETLR